MNSFEWSALRESLWVKGGKGEEEWELVCPLSWQRFSGEEALAFRQPGLSEPLKQRAARLFFWKPQGLTVNWQLQTPCTLRCKLCYRPRRDFFSLPPPAEPSAKHPDRPDDPDRPARRDFFSLPPPAEPLGASSLPVLPEPLQRDPPAELSLTGGDLLLLPQPGEVLHCLRRALPWTRLRLLLAGVSLQRRRVFPSFVEALLACQIKARLSFYGGRATTHDRMTRSPGSFEDALATARLLQDRGVPVEAAFLLTRHNFHERDELLEVATTYFDRDFGCSTLVYPSASSPSGSPSPGLGSSPNLPPIQQRGDSPPGSPSSAWGSCPSSAWGSCPSLALSLEQFHQLLAEPLFAGLPAEYLSPFPCAGEASSPAEQPLCAFPTWDSEGGFSFCELLSGGEGLSSTSFDPKEGKRRGAEQSNTESEGRLSNSSASRSQGEAFFGERCPTCQARFLCKRCVVFLAADPSSRVAYCEKVRACWRQVGARLSQLQEEGFRPLQERLWASFGSTYP